jgi:hypothetical protein
VREDDIGVVFRADGEAPADICRARNDCRTAEEVDCTIVELDGSCCLIPRGGRCSTGAEGVRLRLVDIDGDVVAEKNHKKKRKEKPPVRRGVPHTPKEVNMEVKHRARRSRNEAHRTHRRPSPPLRAGSRDHFT